MKTGLVLEGGAQRGIYTAGVLDVFMEQGISFDGVIGVSAGAIHGCSFVAKQHGRSIGYTLKYCRDKRYMSYYSLLTTGNIVGEKFCYHDIPQKLYPFDNESFEKSKTKFYVTCSNLETGEAEYIHCEELRKKISYLRASASMPFVSQICKINGKKYLDGGICDSIPVQAFKKMGYDKCVSVHTRVAGYRKSKNKLSWLAGIIYHKYPKFAEAIKNRHIMYNRELEDIENMEKEGKVFIIRPSRLSKISHMEKDLSVLNTVYNMGRDDAIANLQKLKKFLEK